MKVRLKTKGFYSTLRTKVGDIVEAKKFDERGYDCLVKYGGRGDFKEGWLYFYNEELEFLNESDPIVESVINQFKTRSEIGIKKYGTTLERTDVDVLGWLNHLQQELQDATLYIERLKQEYEKKDK